MKAHLALCLFSVSLLHVDAVVLARWTPVSTASGPAGSDYDNGPDTPPASEVASGLTASVLDRIGGAEFGGGNGGPVWPGLAIDGASGITLGDYTTFTLTPSAGFTLDFDTITYTYQSYGEATNGGYLFFLRSSADGFASDLATDSANTGGGLITFDASSLTGVASATEFRIYASAPTGTGGNRWFDLAGSDTDPAQGIIVNGTAVPEVSSVLLSGFAGLLLLRRRR